MDCRAHSRQPRVRESGQSVNAESFAELVNARRAGRGRWAARCPAHEDGSPSLSISEGRDGRVLLNCFAGCSLTSILEALNLSIRDLFAGEPPTREQKAFHAQREQERASERKREREIHQRASDRVKRFDAVNRSLAAKLAHTPDDAPDGDALSRLFHESLDKLRNAQSSLEALL